MIARDESLRIGVYICHCGTNIAGVIDVEALASWAEEQPHVALARHYKYMCSDPGQELVKRDIREFNLNRIVVAACSPNLHEPTFRRAAENAGLNRFLVQMANIREQVSWVTDDKGAAYAKAQAHLAAAIGRVARHEPLQRQFVQIQPRALVVGGGIAGIQAALTMADAGKDVILVERDPSIGGHMAMFDKTFPTLDCAACILTPKMTAVKLHPNIKLLTYSTVESVEGSVGNYHVKIRRRPRYIDESLCVGCMLCIEGCVFTRAKFPNPFDQGLGTRKPVWVPFAQAVPPIPVIDPETCLEIARGKCKQGCVEACGERDAIRFDQQEHDRRVQRRSDRGHHRLPGVRPVGHSLLRLRTVTERLHELGGRTTAQRRRTDLRQADSARRLDAQERGHHPLRGKPRRQLSQVLFASLLHVRVEDGAPGP